MKGEGIDRLLRGQPERIDTSGQPQAYHVLAQILFAAKAGWRPVIPGVVPVTIFKIEGGDNLVCVLEIESQANELILNMPLINGMHMKKKTVSFVQWIDPRTKVKWGLNFMAPIHTDEFINTVNLCQSLVDEHKHRTKPSDFESAAPKKPKKFMPPPAEIDFDDFKRMSKTSKSQNSSLTSLSSENCENFPSAPPPMMGPPPAKAPPSPPPEDTDPETVGGGENERAVDNDGSEEMAPRLLRRMSGDRRASVEAEESERAGPSVSHSAAEVESAANHLRAKRGGSDSDLGAGSAAEGADNAKEGADELSSSSSWAAEAAAGKLPIPIVVETPPSPVPPRHGVDGDGDDSAGAPTTTAPAGKPAKPSKPQLPSAAPPVPKGAATKGAAAPAKPGLPNEPPPLREGGGGGGTVGGSPSAQVVREGKLKMKLQYLRRDGKLVKATKALVGAGKEGGSAFAFWKKAQGGADAATGVNGAVAGEGGAAAGGPEPVARPQDIHWTAYDVSLRSDSTLVLRVPGAGAGRGKGGEAKRAGGEEDKEKAAQADEPPLVVSTSDSLLEVMEERDVPSGHEFVFVLSVADGRTFLVEAESEEALDGWIESIFMVAAFRSAGTTNDDAAASVCRRRAKALKTSLDRVAGQLKNSGGGGGGDDDSTSAAAASEDPALVRKVESLVVERYQLLCYSAVLEGEELPSQRAVLRQLPNATKVELRSVGSLSMTTLHALLSARPPVIGGGSDGIKSSSSSRSIGVDGDDAWAAADESAGVNEATAAARQASPVRRAMQLSQPDKNGAGEVMVEEFDSSRRQHFFARALLPSREELMLPATNDMVLHDVMEMVWHTRGLSPHDHFIGVPSATYTMDSTLDEVIAWFIDLEVMRCPVEKVTLYRPANGGGLGLWLNEDTSGENRQVFVSRVAPGGPAARAGLLGGETLLSCNNVVVSGLDLAEIAEIMRNAVDGCVMVVRLSQAQAVRKYAESIAEVERFTDLLDAMVPDHKEASLQKYISDHTCPPLHAGAGGGDGDDAKERPLADEEVTSLCIEPVPVASLPFDDAERAERFGLDAQPVDVALRLVVAASGGMAPWSQEVAALTDRLVDIARSCDALCGQARALMPAAEGGMRIHRVIDELVMTESNYVKDLGDALELFVHPMESAGLLEPLEQFTLFCNLEALATFHHDFLEQLAHAVEISAHEDHHGFTVDPGPIVRVFSESEAALSELYAMYCGNYPDAMKLLESAQANAAFKQFLLDTNPSGEQSLGLAFFLVKPVQRVLKYPLLMRELVDAFVKDGDAAGARQLEEAAASVRQVADNVNEVTWRKECEQKADDLFQHIENYTGPGRQIMGRLLQYSLFTRVDSGDGDSFKHKREIEFFMFRDAVIFTKPRAKSKQSGEHVYDCKGYINVVNLSVTPRPDTPDFKNMFDLVSQHGTDKKGAVDKVFTLCARTPDEKTRWVHLVTDLIESKVAMANRRRAEAMPPKMASMEEEAAVEHFATSKRDRANFSTISDQAGLNGAVSSDPVPLAEAGSATSIDGGSSVASDGRGSGATNGSESTTPGGSLPSAARRASQPEPDEQPLQTFSRRPTAAAYAQMAARDSAEATDKNVVRRKSSGIVQKMKSLVHHHHKHQDTVPEEGAADGTPAPTSDDSSSKPGFFKRRRAATVTEAPTPSL